MRAPLILAALAAPLLLGACVTSKTYPTYQQELDTLGEYEDGDTREYAEMVAPTYFEEPDQRAEGPEECARNDFAYWDN